jgi:hypothetical protein
MRAIVPCRFRATPSGFQSAFLDADRPRNAPRALSSRSALLSRREECALRTDGDLTRATTGEASRQFASNAAVRPAGPRGPWRVGYLRGRIQPPRRDGCVARIPPLDARRGARVSRRCVPRSRTRCRRSDGPPGCTEQGLSFGSRRRQSFALNGTSPPLQRPDAVGTARRIRDSPAYSGQPGVIQDSPTLPARSRHDTVGAA